MNWVQRKIYLYNVTFGLFMLDWWERCLFNILVIVLMWFIFYNGSRYVTDFCKSERVLGNQEDLATETVTELQPENGEVILTNVVLSLNRKKI
ncbi:hypothetical protein POTOM_009168 [Populus tomentosa]|uniref:Uncharacterized protein n=1 Tax=Populus tomentosa TaxID=118781 RepID=A0A8X8AIS2_POPTO|nr:hypothetical protein POTOM_009168 [Populus tomentosa]